VHDRFSKHCVALSLAAAVALAGCGGEEVGIRGSIYMSPDSDGKTNADVFYSDYATTPAIYIIVPVVTDSRDDVVSVAIKVRDVDGLDMHDTAPDPILVATFRPGVQSTTKKFAVRFPDPPPQQIFPDGDAGAWVTLTPVARAIGHFRAVVTFEGQTQTVSFQINNSQTPDWQDAGPGYFEGTPPPAPAPGLCAQPNGMGCPLPTLDDSVPCCTTAGNCGIGIAGTGLCY
jgi:hypothetical protein